MVCPATPHSSRALQAMRRAPGAPASESESRPPLMNIEALTTREPSSWTRDMLGVCSGMAPTASLGRS